MRVTASQPGLAFVRVRDGRGPVLAHAVVPVYRAGTSTVQIGLSATGTRVLRHGHRDRVRVGASFRDLLATTANARTVSGVLR